MRYYVGLDVSLKRTAICVVDEDCLMVWQGWAESHPEMIVSVLDRWVGGIERIGLETGSLTPWLARGLKALGLPVVVMDARRAAAAVQARPVKTDRTDARALAEMLHAGWFTPSIVWGVREVGGQSPDQGPVVGPGPAGAQQAELFRPDPGLAAPVRDPAGVAPGQQEV